MSLTLKQIGRAVTAKLPREGAVPVSVEWGQGGQPARIVYGNGSLAAGSCLRCPDAPCMEYRDSELHFALLPSFPADPLKRVCPTEAIRWPLETTAPSIDKNLCISCGLCVARCPVAAIHMTARGAVVNDEPNGVFTVRQTVSSLNSVRPVATRYASAKRSGRLLSETEQTLEQIYAKMTMLAGTSDAQLPNLLSRNLLLQLGVGSAIRRRGDNNVRMDMLLGPPGVPSGTAEVESGIAGIMDAPRNVLDNVAVLSSRHGFDRTQLVPMIIASSLPNQRSDYWQLVRDIGSVLGLRIGSLTLAAMMVLAWERVRVRISPANEFYADSTSHSIRGAIEALIGRPVNCPQGVGGYFESQK